MALMGWDWMTGVLLLLAGGLAGGFAVRIFGADSGREKQLRQELDDTRKAFHDYKGEVEAHFRQTAVAVNALTESYRSVYDQLRTGADRLCGDGGRLLDLKPVPVLEDTAAESPEQKTQPEAATAAPPSPLDPPPEASEAEMPAAAEELSESLDATPVGADEDAQGEDAAPEEVRAPLDYAADGDDEEHEKTLH